MGAPVWCLWYLTLVVVCCVWTVGAFNLTILHTNDVHSRFDQINAYSGQCSDSQAAAGKCFGGYPRLYTKVTELRAQYNNTVLVDAGDQYQGTIWFFKYGGNITAHFMNWLGYDIMALGNHEFDKGPEGVDVLMGLANFSIISSNVNASSYPNIQSRLSSSKVLEIGGEKVAFVGYTTTTTVTISNPQKITFSDEVEAVRKEVETLTAQGINKIVCVGHAGFSKDLHVARDIAGVDVVVGGHTNTFLYTGTAPSNEDPAGTYPQVVTRQDGSRALVVQDYAFAKYLGFLQVEFNDAGEVVAWSGNPILLNSSVQRDPDLLAEMLEWKKGLDVLRNKTIGRTAVLLQAKREICRLQECNLGNLISDAMVMQNLRHSDALKWNHVAIALINSGGIRASLEPGSITVADLLMVQPFRSTIDIVVVNGSTLRAIMEHSASQWDPEEQHGGFLQHSGLHVVYNLSEPVGQRVVDIKVKCTDCLVPRFVDLEEDQVYKVIVPSFLAGGGDDYTMIRDDALEHHLNGDLDIDVLTEYISKYSPITAGLEGRIRFVNHTQSPNNPCEDVNGPSSMTVTMTASVTMTMTTMCVSVAVVGSLLSLL